MISETINLIKLLRNLAQRKSEIDKSYFENFIEPVWQTFTKVHEGYKDSFLKCKNYLDENNTSTGNIGESLVEMLKSDSTYYSDSRRELVKMVENIPVEGIRVKHDLLLSFKQSMYEYFASPTMNSVRAHARSTFSHLSKGDRLSVDRAKHVFDSMTFYLQSHYEDVAKSYYRLKKELLS